MSAIFLASSMPDRPVPQTFPDVGLHEVEYFGLTLLLIRACSRASWNKVTPSMLAVAWFIAVAFGATDEWHQSFVPNREAEISDVRADAVGASLAVLLAWAWSIIRRL
jgi:VanZ family protein